jgi:hypothetical protein
MAEPLAHRVRSRRPPRAKPKSRLTAEQIASALVPRREKLIDRLPTELAVARGLSRDQAELVVDEAIDYLVTEYEVPIFNAAELERAFWAAAAIRSRRAHDNRAATVRAGWRRVELDGHDIPSTASEPEAAAIEQSETEALLEFAATLTELERTFLAYRYGVAGRMPGSIVIARELGLPLGEVRAVELSLHHKLTRFIAIMAAGTLCEHRRLMVAALADGGLSEATERVARLHLEHCPACRLEHAARLRDLRSGKLPRDVASILPIPPTVESVRGTRALWDTLTDWATRPFAHDAVVTGSQVGAAGRGLGGLATVKLAALCIGGASLAGGSLYCVTSTDLVHRDRNRPNVQRAAPTATATGAKEDVSFLKPRPTPATRSAPPPRKPRTKATPEPTPAPTAYASNHESAGAISPAPSGSASGGGSEFGPGPATRAATQPAAPAAGGGAEFP